MVDVMGPECVPDMVRHGNMRCGLVSRDGLVGRVLDSPERGLACRDELIRLDTARIGWTGAGTTGIGQSW